MLCILTPSGYGDIYQVKNLFKRTDLLNTTSKIKIGCILPPILFTFCGQHGYDPCYKLYFLLQGKLLSNLLQPIWQSDEEIKALESCIDELLCFQEGLFPVSICNLANHQLIHLCNSIREFGNIKCTGTQHGERGNGVLKRLYNNDNKGGVNKHYNLVDKLDRKEKECQNEILSYNMNYINSNDVEEEVTFGKRTSFIWKVSINILIINFVNKY